MVIDLFEFIETGCLPDLQYGESTTATIARFGKPVYSVAHCNELESLSYGCVHLAYSKGAMGSIDICFADPPFPDAAGIGFVNTARGFRTRLTELNVTRALLAEGVCVEYLSNGVNLKGQKCRVVIANGRVMLFFSMRSSDRPLVHALGCADQIEFGQKKLCLAASVLVRYAPSWLVKAVDRVFG